MTKLGKILITKPQIDKKIKQLAKRITKDYKKELITITVLKGAKTFSKNLRKEIKKISNLKVTNSNIQLSSYKKTTKTSGKITLKQPIKSNLKHKNVLIIEDIVDTGLTLVFLKNYLLKQKKAASVKICTLTNKPSRRKKKIKLDYVGFDVPNLFVVGYGIDFAEKYRNLSCITYVKEKN